MNKLSEKHLTVLRSLRLIGPKTVDEFVTRYDLYINSWAPTFTHLRNIGLVDRTGETRRTSHGSFAHVLDLTDRGRDLLARMEHPSTAGAAA